MKKIFFILNCFILSSQTINLNETNIINDLRIEQISGNINPHLSFNIKPFSIENINISSNSFLSKDGYAPKLNNSSNDFFEFRLLPIDFNIEFNSLHPYNRNNGSMVPNRGYQQLISVGIYTKIGPLTIQLKPENIYAQNRNYQGFWDGHDDNTWVKRYNLWNHIDVPERFGNSTYKKNLIGQSSIKLNFKFLSLGISNENLWWGPSIRNSIMMSNHAQSFKHISFNTNKPFKTPIGNFNWQIVTGRLEGSGFSPPEKIINGSPLFVPRINQQGKIDDWRYFQGAIITYSPKWIKNFDIGIIRWVQMYHAMVDGQYWWMEGNTSYFPLFSNIFRKNDRFENYEAQTDQAAGAFFRWVWLDSKAELYAEFHYNDAKLNLRDLLLDSDHARAATIGIQKIFSSKNNNIKYLFSWEWTQMEQTSSRLIREANSWYRHRWVYHGYTNNGEVMGSAIGPGSNSHYFSLKKLKKLNKLGIAIEIVDNDNDFYYYAFERDGELYGDFRRYWKDFNFIFSYEQKFKNLIISSDFIFSRNLNYQWEIEPNPDPWYTSGKDVNNLHLNLKMTYFIPNIFKN